MREPNEIKIGNKKLSTVLERHEKWLRDEKGGERANLSRANLESANLYSANLESANLESAENIPALIMSQLAILPDEGKVIGWKKLRYGAIAKLEIGARTPRSNAMGRKCRAKFAKVLAIWDAEGEIIRKGWSQHDNEFVYEVGKPVTCDNWNANRWQECSGGIHFFITRLEAENY